MEDEDAVVVQRTENADADQLEAMARDCLREATPEAFEACLQDIFKISFYGNRQNKKNGTTQFFTKFLKVTFLIFNLLFKHRGGEGF